jgi:hypothetical protein
MIAMMKMIWPNSAALDEAVQQKNLMASQMVLIAQGLLGVGAIIFRIKAKNRD